MKQHQKKEPINQIDKSLKPMNYLKRKLYSRGKLFTILTLRGLRRSMPRKGEPILRAEYIPVLATGFFFGSGFAAVGKWDFWTVVSSTGSLLAGLGTVGLLAFGWFARKDWVKQNTFDKTIKYLLEAEELQLSIRLLSTEYLDKEKHDYNLAVRLTKKSARLSALLKAIKGFGHLSKARICTINFLTKNLDAFVKAQNFAIHDSHNEQYKRSVEKIKSCSRFPFTALNFTSHCLDELQK